MPSSSYAYEKKPLEWKIRNKNWNSSFETSYEEFISILGKAKEGGICHTTNDCLKNKIANPRYFNLNPDSLMDIFADCADLPYVLRAYFSWMNDLPFSYPIGLRPAGLQSADAFKIKAEISELEVQMETAGFFKKQSLKRQISDLRKTIYGDNTKDIRYNRYGNEITEKKYVTDGMNINSVITEVELAISTATFRTNAKNNTTSELFRDTYPVNISTNAIKPGTILYDPNGHVAIVYEVSSNGKIHLIDAHPDNSLSSITYGEKFSRTIVEVGGGFSNWRPFSYDNGIVKAKSNDDLSDFSLIQFQQNPVFYFNEKPMSFYEFVRNKLTLGNLVYKPVEELSEALSEICSDVQVRKLSVDASLASGLQNQSHPKKLPANIYGTDGDWESYSTPSRDARLKASIRETRNLVIKMIEGYKKMDPSIEYNGDNLVGDLMNTYREVTRKCVLQIQKTDGSNALLNLNDVLRNIYLLSFDPYLCTELRWGLIDSKSIKSCGQSSENMDWYYAEQGIAKRIDRDYAMKMDYSLIELPRASISLGVEENISIADAIRE